MAFFISYLAWVLLGFLMSCDSLVSSVSFERFWAVTSSSITSILFIVCITSETPYACILECSPTSCLYFIPFCVLSRTGPSPQISSLWGCPWTGVLSILWLPLFELLPLLSLRSWLMAQPCALNPVSGRRRGAWRNRTPYFSHPGGLNILAWPDLAATEMERCAFHPGWSYVWQN